MGKLEFPFQSLFSWNLLLMGSPGLVFFSVKRVSILVFVELALDVYAARSKIPVGPLFQSLFSWNLLLMITVGRVAALKMFQSLFSWNLLLMILAWSFGGRLSGVSILVFVELALDVSWHRIMIQCGGVSILVFVELALDEVDERGWAFCPVWFQSLFSWNLLLMLLQIYLGH